MASTIPKTMRAARFYPASKTFGVENIPVPAIGDDEILIKTIAASMCHSDMMLKSKAIPGTTAGDVTPGHEATGKVVAVGPGVTRFKVGDEVGFINAYHACFDCRGCDSHYLFCEKGLVQTQGFSIDGYFAEYSKVDPKAAVILPKGIDASTAAPIFCAGITAYHGIQAAGVQPGQWIAIVGCGGLGQYGIRYAKAMGYKVIGVDVSDDSLGFAREAKIDYVFNSRSQPDYKEQIRQITGGGVEGVSVFTGVQAAYAGAVDLLRIGGVLVCVGIPAPPEVPFSILDLTLGRYKLVPANNGIKSPEDLYECVEFTHKNNIVTPTKFFELEQINEMADNVEKNVYPGMRMAVKFS